MGNWRIEGRHVPSQAKHIAMRIHLTTQSNNKMKKVSQNFCQDSELFAEIRRSSKNQNCSYESEVISVIGSDLSNQTCSRAANTISTIAISPGDHNCTQVSNHSQRSVTMYLTIPLTGTVAKSSHPYFQDLQRQFRL